MEGKGESQCILTVRRATAEMQSIVFSLAVLVRGRAKTAADAGGATASLGRLRGIVGNSHEWARKAGKVPRGEPLL